MGGMGPGIPVTVTQYPVKRDASWRGFSLEPTQERGRRANRGVKGDDPFHPVGGGGIQHRVKPVGPIDRGLRLAKPRQGICNGPGDKLVDWAGHRQRRLTCDMRQCRDSVGAQPGRKQGFRRQLFVSDQQQRPRFAINLVSSRWRQRGWVWIKITPGGIEPTGLRQECGQPVKPGGAGGGDVRHH